MKATFALLDTQLGDKAGEIRQIKRQICELPILPDNYDIEVQLDVLKKILRYLTLFNRLFSPEDLNVIELSDSMLSSIPKAQPMSAVRSYQKVISDNLSQRAQPRSETYYNIFMHEISNLTRLSANAESKQNLFGTSGIQI